MKKAHGRVKVIKFWYNGYHGRECHTLRIKPAQIDSEGDIWLTPAQLRRHIVCPWHDCECGESIAIFRENGAVLKPISPQGVMWGNYPGAR
jgi:hypothetical protein